MPNSQQTGAPLLVDNDYQNTIDFHAAATNFLKVLDTYLNETATGYAHNYSQYTADPITSEAQFFADLNNGKLNLQTLKSGINHNVKGTLTEYATPQLNTDEIWKTDTDGTVYSRINSGNIQWQAINQQTGAVRWVNIEQNVIDLVKSYTSKLDPSYGISKMNEEFILYWIEKFRASHDLVKQTYQALVTDPTQDMFTEFSDSMGLLARIAENVDCSVLPLTDPEFVRSGVTPRPYNAILDDKIDANTKQMIFQMSKYNNAQFRDNLVKLINIVTTSTYTHGENLVTDELDYYRVYNMTQELNGYVANVLGVVAKIMFYIRTLPDINQQSTMNFSYQAVIEDSLVQVDILKNKVQTLQSGRVSMTNLDAQNV